ncbi:MAG: hypothetical protein FJX76_27650 [Armatimonadetes bacterium]|nr:hypothetical protein [Armatimonadota bacterium]
MPDPIVDWYDQLKKEGFPESTLLVTIAQRLSLAYDHATDVKAVLKEAGLAEGEPAALALERTASLIVNYIRAEAECTRQLIQELVAEKN